MNRFFFKKVLYLNNDEVLRDSKSFKRVARVHDAQQVDGHHIDGSDSTLACPPAERHKPPVGAASGPPEMPTRSEVRAGRQRSVDTTLT